MTRILPRILRLAAAIIAVTALPALVLAMGQPAAAASTDVRLSITLSTGAESVSDGDVLTYTAEIRNTGATVGARIVLSPPAYVTLEEADGAVVLENEATWSTALPGGATTTFEIPAKVGEVPSDEVRVTALASVYVGDSSSPIIRTAVADRIEGVADEQVVASSDSPSILLWAGAGLVVSLAAVAAVFWTRSRRGASTSPTDTDDGRSPD